MSKLDKLYRRMLITRFFEKGWGKPENLQRLFEFRKIISNRNECFRLIPKDYKIEITKEETQSDCTYIEGHFKTPFEYFLPGLVPEVVQTAKFQVILPKTWKDKKHKPVCIHLAGTGDHFFWRRRNFIAKPLLKEANIGAIILENPFYGTRKPEDQVRSNLRNVSDIFVMGGCLVLECLVLLHWCERNGLGPLGITGLSMGGHMASIAATNWPKPLVLVPCLSWSTASAVFTSGVMSQSINWDMLETQYYSDGNYCEKLSKMVTVVDEAFKAGQHFIRNFNESMKELEHDITDQNDSNVGDNSCLLIKNKTNVQLDKDNSFNLSDKLHKKIMSKHKFELSNSEVNELTDKINENVKQEQELQRFVKDPEVINTSAIISDLKPTSIFMEKPKTNDLWNLTKLMNYLLPSNSSPNKLQPIDTTKTNWWEREALQFMRGVMDECTHLKNFSIPYDTSLAIAVCAKDDAYVPRKGCSSLEDIWPGVEVRYLDAGHVSAYVLHQKLFRSTIIEAFERAKKKVESSENSLDEEIDLTPKFTYQELLERYEKYQSR